MPVARPCGVGAHVKGKKIHQAMVWWDSHFYSQVYRRVLVVQSSWISFVSGDEWRQGLSRRPRTGDLVREKVVDWHLGSGGRCLCPIVLWSAEAAKVAS